MSTLVFPGRNSHNACIILVRVTIVNAAGQRLLDVSRRKVVRWCCLQLLRNFAPDLRRDAVIGRVGGTGEAMLAGGSLLLYTYMYSRHRCQRELHC